MALIGKAVKEIATQVARTLVRVTSQGDSARLSLPLMYPGGSMVGVEISRLRDGFLVSDVGGARREASLLGGERTFLRIAREIADRFAVRFDKNMFFDMDVEEQELVTAVIAVANAAKTAVESTALHLASVEHADFRAHLWDRLQRLYGSKSVERKPSLFKGASEQWEFDAAITGRPVPTLFELVMPNANSVNSAVSKFLDVKDLGDGLTHRVAVLTNPTKTPRLLLLGRNARTLPFESSDEEYLTAA
jgi:hypothetical protein